MRQSRSLKALLVDVDLPRAQAIGDALTSAGWAVDAERTAGADGLAGALLDHSWDAVLYGGDGDGAVPARKALALVRLADPHLPFLALSTEVHGDDLARLVSGFDGEVAVAPDPEALAASLGTELKQAALRREEGGTHRLLAAQQAVADLLAEAPAPADLLAAAPGALGEPLGWTIAELWLAEQDDEALRCAATWLAMPARPALIELAALDRMRMLAAGRGLPGRVWAFRRPVWIADLSREPELPRGTESVRAGLGSAVAFPVANGERCLAVIELLGAGPRRPEPQELTLLAGLGRQLARYAERATAKIASGS